MTTPARIVKELRPQCRHCHRKLTLTEVIDEMFARIAARLAAGERVELPGIGILRPKAVKDRVISTMPNKTKKLVPGWVEVNFRATTALKGLLNPNRGKAKPLEKQDVKPTRKRTSRKRKLKRRAKPNPDASNG